MRNYLSIIDTNIFVSYTCGVNPADITKEPKNLMYIILGDEQAILTFRYRRSV